MQNILITGATGTIGAYAALHFKEKGFNVIATGRRKDDNGFFGHHGIRYFSVDIASAEGLSEIPNENIDAIVNCAGVMPAKMQGYNPSLYVNSIVHGTLNLLEFARIRKTQKFVFTQSRADSNYLMGTTSPIPADIEKKFPLRGDHSIYAICKNAAVDFIEHYHYQFGISRFILRLPTIYAYHPDPFFFVDGARKMMAYRNIMEQAMKGEQLEVWGDPNKEKEIVSVKDLCQLFEKCVGSPLNGGMYNVGGPKGVTLEDQILGIAKVFCPADRQSEIVYRHDMPDARQFVHDISKTKAELGYDPKFDYLSLLKDFKMEMEKERFSILWGTRQDYIQ